MPRQVQQQPQQMPARPAIQHQGLARLRWCPLSVHWQILLRQQLPGNSVIEGITDEDPLQNLSWMVLPADGPDEVTSLAKTFNHEQLLQAIIATVTLHQSLLRMHQVLKPCIRSPAINYCFSGIMAANAGLL